MRYSASDTPIDQYSALESTLSKEMNRNGKDLEASRETGHNLIPSAHECTQSTHRWTQRTSFHIPQNRHNRCTDTRKVYVKTKTKHQKKSLTLLWKIMFRAMDNIGYRENSNASPLQCNTLHITRTVPISVNNSKLHLRTSIGSGSAPCSSSSLIFSKWRSKVARWRAVLPWYNTYAKRERWLHSMKKLTHFLCKSRSHQCTGQDQLAGPIDDKRAYEQQAQSTRSLQLSNSADLQWNGRVCV